MDTYRCVMEVQLILCLFSHGSPHVLVASGMGIRMVSNMDAVYLPDLINDLKAMDLGLNCDAARWKVHGQDLFSTEEIRTRRQIWWGCCLADR